MARWLPLPVRACLPRRSAEVNAAGNARAESAVPLRAARRPQASKGLIELFRLAPEPRPATDAEPLLQVLVLLPILQRRPGEQATDKDDWHEHEDANHDRSGTVHRLMSFALSRVSGRSDGRVRVSL